MKTVELLDFCLPDFFSGYPKPVIAVAVFGNMTAEEVQTAYNEELNNFWECLEYEYKTDELKLLEDYGKDVSNFHPIEDMEEVEDMEDIEPAYLYFAVCQMTYSNGMRFLNP